MSLPCGDDGLAPLVVTPLPGRRGGEKRGTDADSALRTASRQHSAAIACSLVLTLGTLLTSPHAASATQLIDLTVMLGTVDDMPPEPSFASGTRQPGATMGPAGVTVVELVGTGEDLP